MKKRLSIPALILCLGPLAFAGPAPQISKKSQAAPKAQPTTGLDLEGMDKSLQPGDSFFAYANGGWLKKAVIPEDRSRFGISSEVNNLTSKRIEALIQEAGKRSDKTSRMISDFYQSYLDIEAIETKGLTPLKATLDNISGLQNRDQLSKYLGTTLRADMDLFNATDTETPNILGLWVAQDLNNPKRYVPFLAQGGLGLPDREYYVSQDTRMAELREAYQKHLATLLRLAGFENAEARAAKALELETAIAQAHWTRSDTGEFSKGNNPWKRADFDTKAPGMNWKLYLQAAGLDQQKDFIIWQPSAIQGIAKLVGTESLDAWKDYLALRLLEHHADILPKAFRDASFDFHGRTLGGVPKAGERWKAAIGALDASLGEAVGKLYVTQHFPASEKARAQKMVKALMKAFEKRIDAVEWMSPETKKKAKAKLAVMKVGVGYPDRWTDYSSLQIKAGDAIGNRDRAERFALKGSLAKLGHKVDRSEWVMTPHVVNAVNLPAMNAMNFPAGMLQPPFFDPNRPEVMDFGAIGAIIGHEISHSFDDQGALFDHTGKLNNWWTPQDLATFQAAAQKLIQQYDAYKPFPDVSVNGKLTLGENIADLAGLAAAYDAYRLSLGGKEAPESQGLTGDQQFFLSYAISWRSKSREQALRRQLLTDSHTPAQYRPETVRNLDAWYQAFGVKEGQALYLKPEDRIKIW